MSPPPPPGQLPPGTPENFAWFASWISEQFGKLEGKLDAMSKEFVTQRELDRLEQDVTRAHEKVRALEQGPIDEIEERLRAVELQVANDGGENKIRWSIGEKVLGGVIVVVTAIVLAWLGLKGL